MSKFSGLKNLVGTPEPGEPELRVENKADDLSAHTAAFQAPAPVPVTTPVPVIVASVAMESVAQHAPHVLSAPNLTAQNRTKLKENVSYHLSADLINLVEKRVFQLRESLPPKVRRSLNKSVLVELCLRQLLGKDSETPRELFNLAHERIAGPQ